MAKASFPNSCGEQMGSASEVVREFGMANSSHC